MKLLKKIALSTTLFVLTALLLCSCAMIKSWFPSDDGGEGEPPHTHKWGKWITEIAAACDAGGQQVRVCACGERETKTTDPTAAHILDADNTCVYCNAPLTPTEGLAFEALTSTTCSVIGIGSADRTATSLIIPHTYNGMSVTSIGEEAFKEMKTLEQLVLPYTLTVVEDFAFSDCNALRAVAIPQATTSLKQYAFDCCYQLSSVNFGTNAALRSIGTCAFFCASIETLDFGDNSQLRTIGDSAFFSCMSLTSIRFGANSKLTSIYKYAFNSCEGLTTVVLPDKLTTLREGAFYDCKNLVSIVLPKSLTSIGKSTFWLCASMRNIYYCGSVAEWDRISLHAQIGDGFDRSTIYYYSESEIPPNDTFKYWHYAPTPW